MTSRSPRLWPVDSVDVTTTRPVPEGGETLAQITGKLEAGVIALGGDDPPPNGGPGPGGRWRRALLPTVRRECGPAGAGVRAR